MGKVGYGLIGFMHQGPETKLASNMAPMPAAALAPQQLQTDAAEVEKASLGFVHGGISSHNGPF
ncbi:MAG: hypothetical protein ACO1QR_01600 [Chthoniobacteraceae bacterium]